MTVFLGTGATCAAIVVSSTLRWNAYSIAGSLLYLAGTIIVTGMCNVPRNNALAAMDPAKDTAYWARFAAEWTAWNHVRTAAALIAAVLLSLSVAR
jgi:uncharacterized membrane protein